ncbi:MAG TPA: PAS domain S-box protein [Methanocella sp.]|nr:PAS domain S-box protein [Methanocella sp.]
MATDLRVLIIGGNEAEAAQISAELAAAGYLVRLELAHHLGSLDRLLDEPWDVAISEMKMDGVTWSGALDLVRAKAPKLPFIIRSSEVEGESAAEMIIKGASDFVNKERPGRLPNAVRSAIATAELRRGTGEMPALYHDLGLLTDSIDQGIVRVDGEGTCTFINRAALTMLGYRPEEIMGRRLHPLIHHGMTDDSSCTAGLCGVEQAIKTGVAQRVSDQIFWRRDGSSFPVEYSAYPIISDSVISGAVVLFIDITVRKQVEEKLLITQATIDSFHDPCIWSDPAGRIVYVNKSACQSLGYSREELLTMGIIDIDPGVKGKQYREVFAAAGVNPAHFETWHKNKSGKLFPVAISSKNYQFGGREYCISFVRDITERRQAEEKVGRLSIAVEQGPAIVVITDTQGKIEYVNQKFSALTGYSAAEVIGRTPSMLKSGHTPRAVYDELWDTIRSGREWRGEFQNRKKNGDTYWESALIAPIKGADGRITHFMAVKEDITERRQAETLLMIRMQLMEFAAVHSLAEILQHTLDEVSRITGSQVGFYYFVNEDQRTLSLQAWSTRTLQEFCRVSGTNPHNNVDDAGVWVDCIRERRPVIHNDYASLPHRKGMPEGHVPIVRELLVPITRGDSIVAVLGVGNKPSDYTGRDVDIVAYLADIAWEITERKQAEEALRESESKFREIFNNSNDGILLLEADENWIPFRIVEANDVVLTWAGIPKERLLRTDPFDMLLDFSEEKFARTFATIRETGHVTIDLILRNGDGSGMPVELSAHAFMSGGKRMIQTISRDMTENRKSQAVLEKYQLFSKYIRDMVIFLDTSGRIFEANDAAMKLLGYSRDELLQMNIKEIRGPDVDAVKLHSQLTQAYENGVLFDTIYYRKDGTKLNVQVSSQGTMINGEKVILAIVRDITPIKQAEAALVESERRLTELIENTGLLAIAEDHNGKITYVNDNMLALAGRARKDVIGRCCMDVFTPEESKSCIRDMFDEINQMGDIGRYANTESEILSKNGQRHVISWFSMLQKNLAGDITGITRVGVNITRQKEYEASLKASEEKFRTVFEDSAIGIILSTYDGRIIQYNRAIQTMLGRTDSSMTIKDFKQFLDENTQQDLYRRFMAMLAENKDSYEMETRITREDGRAFWGRVIVSLIRDEQKRPLYLVTMIHDITRQKQYEKALEDSEETFRSVVEQCTDGIMIVDHDGQIVQYNRAMEMITGRKRADIIGKPLWDYLYEVMIKEAQAKIPYEKMKSIVVSMVWDASMLEPVTMPYEDIELLDGTRRSVNSIIFPIKTSRGMYLGSISRDVTEQRLIQEQLESDRAELKRSNEELEKFAYVASHDLQEPLRTVSSYVQLLQRRYEGKLDSSADEYINYAVEGTGRMQQMIRDLLQYSRISTRGQSPVPTDLGPVLDQVLQNLSASIKESQGSIVHTPMPVVLVDPLQASQLLQNLISNALKFRKKGVSPEVRITAERKDKFWEIAVSDNGIGIDPQYNDRLFVIFQRLHSRKDYEGNGIGLAICKKIVERHGGRIWIESAPGAGTTFRFILPAMDNTP